MTTDHLISMQGYLAIESSPHADRPVTEVGITKLNRWETVDAVKVELEEVIEEDIQWGLVGHVVVDGDVEGICIATEFEHGGGDEEELIKTEVCVHVVH
jgi:hypothetical protein